MERNCEALRAKGATIGSGVFIADEVDVDPGNAELLFIEDGAVISRKVNFILHDSAGNNVCGLPILFAPIVVKKRAYIGVGAIILCGVTIGEHAIVGAGSVVTKDVPARTVVAGNPARVIETLQDYEKKTIRRVQSANDSSFWWHVIPWRERKETGEMVRPLMEWKAGLKAKLAQR